MEEIPDWNSYDPFTAEQSSSVDQKTPQPDSGVSMQVCRLQNEALHKVAVRASVLALSDAFTFLDDLVEGVYSLSKFVPPEARKNEVWSKELLPAMTGALVQNVKINKAFQTTLGVIGQVAITLRQVADQVMREQGSRTSVTIAAEELGAVFGRLAECREALALLDLKMLASFERNAELILSSAMGSNVASAWADQIKVLRDKVDACRKRIVEIENDKAKLIGDIQALSEYLVSLHKMSGQAEQALGEANRRINAIQADIAEANRRMDAIPQTITQTEHHHYSGGWFLWRRRHTETIQRQVKNPNRDSEVQFIESIKRSRFNDVARHGTDAEKAAARRDALEKEIKSVNAQLTAKTNQLKQYTCPKDGAMFQEEADLLGQIEQLQVQIKAIEEQAARMENTYGLRGDVLVNFLVETRSFLRKTQGEALAITPLITLIGNIESYFKANLRIFQIEAQSQTPNKETIFGAGKAMLREIGLLDSCVKALPLLTAPAVSRQTAIQRLRNISEAEAQQAVTS